MTKLAVWVGAEGRPGQIGLLTWLHKCIEEALPDVEEVEWRTAAENLEAVLREADEVLARYGGRGTNSAVVRLGGSLAHVSLIGGRIYCTVAGPNRWTIDETMSLMRNWIPVRILDESLRQIALTIWHHKQDGGGRQRTHEIAVPSWQEIASNYSESTRQGLDRLMNGFSPGKGGQLILWHGAPGTGKTYAIRALAWEWRSWPHLHYITDPEVLFGSDPSYLFQLILEASETWSTDQTKEERWTVLVLEDMAELLAPDARMQMGHGLSRVLNLVDGLLGQGLRLLMLVRTNEPLARLHPAVSRPGRCAAQVEFLELSPSEVREWFQNQGEEVPRELTGDSATIASLHAILDGREPEQSHTIGFAS